MSLIIATGSNIGDSLNYLRLAEERLKQEFDFIAKSRIYKSAAVDYVNQPDFFNQVFEFEIPTASSDEVMQILLQIEKELGRTRDISRGPRTLDLDIIFWGVQHVSSQTVTIPHPRWHERSFVVQPLMELPFFQTIQKWFTIPKSFEVTATPI